jgi:hypothetical protein
MSNPTARRAIEALEENGIVRETTGRDWGKIYLASAIADTIQNLTYAPHPRECKNSTG